MSEAGITGDPRCAAAVQVAFVPCRPAESDLPSQEGVQPIQLAPCLQVPTGTTQSVFVRCMVPFLTFQKHLLDSDQDVYAAAMGSHVLQTDLSPADRSMMVMTEQFLSDAKSLLYPLA